MRDRPRALPSPTLVLTTAALVLTAVAALFLGASLWLPVTAAAIPWFLLLARRRGSFLASAAIPVLVMAALLLTLMATCALRAPLVPALALLACAVGALGIWRVSTAGRTATPAAAVRRRILSALPLLLGGAIWLAVIGIARLVPGAAALSWAMNGDSANNLIFARLVVYANGIAVGGAENPVPLTAGLLGVGMAAGRGDLPSSELLAHDLTVFADTWALTIFVLCAAIGLAVAEIVVGSRRVVRMCVGAAASLIPLTWFVVGYPLEFGFFNTHLALLVVFSSWVIYRRAESSPALSLGLLALACLLVLAIWGPLVVFPGILAFILVLRFRGRVLDRGADGVFAGIAVLSLVLYGALVTLPSILAQASFLAAGGGAFPFSRLILLALIVGTLVLAAVGTRAFGFGTLFAASGWAVSSAIGFGLLLFAARETPDPWISYYPLKFSWLAIVVLVVTVVILAVGIATRWWRRAWSTAIALLVIAGATVGAIQFVSYSRSGYDTQNPLARILAGDFWPGGDAGVERIIEGGDLEHPTILWRSGEPTEGVVNFWILQVLSDSMTENLDLKYIAYGAYDVHDVDDLCLVFDLVDAPLTVVTADSGLPGEVGEACPTALETGEIRVVSSR